MKDYAIIVREMRNKPRLKAPCLHTPRMYDTYIPLVWVQGACSSSVVEMGDENLKKIHLCSQSFSSTSTNKSL